jgi:hypothetical protein
MSELNYNQRTFCTGEDSEADPRATTREIVEFKKQYEAMTREEKGRLPNWLREYIEGNISTS